MGFQKSDGIPDDPDRWDDGVQTGDDGVGYLIGGIRVAA